MPSLDSLGEAVEVGGPALQDTEPLLEDLRDFGVDANPVSKNLAQLLTNFDETGGIERLMDYIFFQVTAINGFDSLSHYLRAGLIAAASCRATRPRSPSAASPRSARRRWRAAARGASARIEPQIADAPAGERAADG